MADGSVKIEITADDKDAQKKLNDLRRGIEKTTKAIDSSTSQRNVISEKLEKARAEAQKTADELERLKELEAREGNVAEDEATNRALDAKIESAQQKALELQKQVEQAEKLAAQEPGNLSATHRTAVIDAREQLPALRNEYAAAQQEVDNLVQKSAKLTDSLERQKQVVADMRASEGLAEGADPSGVIKELERTQASQEKQVSKLEQQEQAVLEKLQQQTAELQKQKEEAGAISQSMQEQTNAQRFQEAMADASKQMKKGFGNILKWGIGIRGLFVLVRRLRSYIKEAVTAFAEADPETKANIDGLKASLNGLKMAWGAAFAPILNFVAPILQRLISWLTAAANAIAAFFAALSGQSTYKRINAGMDSIAESAGGAGAAAEEAEKQVMGFDELNKLNANPSGGGGGGGGGGGASDVELAPVGGKLTEFIETIKKHLLDLELFAGGALLGLGLILTFSGANIPLGLALIAAGAVVLVKAITENWETISKNVKNALSSVAMVAGGLMFGIGLALALSGANVGLGLALVAAGLITAGSAVINWDEIPSNVRKTVAEIAQIVGLSLLALGAVLAFSGAAVPIGIGLMIAGAAALAGGVALDWSYMGTNVSRALGQIMSAIGVALLAIGLILVLSGVGAPLGIGMMIAGGASLAAAAALNWDYLSEKVEGALDKVREKWDNFTEWFDNAWNDLSTWWDGLHLSSFHISLPHIGVTWEDYGGSRFGAALLRFLGIDAVPHLSVTWGAKGGILNAATLIGAGEAGKEALVPLERNTGWIDLIADGIIDRFASGNRLADAISGKALPAVAMGQVVPPNAVSAGGYGEDDITRLLSGITAAFSGGASALPPIKVYIDGKEARDCIAVWDRRASRASG